MSVGLRIYIDESRRYFEDEVCVANKIQDAQFISNAPRDIDYLLKENQRLRGALEQIADGHYDCPSGLSCKADIEARQALVGDSE